MDIAAVVEGAQQALSNPHAGRKWAGQFVSKMSPEDLKKAVETNFDVVTAIINEYSLGDPTVRKLACAIIKRHWKEISSEVRSVPNLIKRLARNPANREQLERPKTITWLNETCVRAYEVFFLYAWPPNKDLRCVYCKTTFMFDILGCVAMDFEGHGKKKLHIVLCPACGRQVQAVF